MIFSLEVEEIDAHAQTVCTRPSPPPILGSEIKVHVK